MGRISYMPDFVGFIFFFLALCLGDHYFLGVGMGVLIGSNLSRILMARVRKEISGLIKTDPGELP